MRHRVRRDAVGGELQSRTQGDVPERCGLGCTDTGDLRKALAVYGLELAHHLVPFRSTKYEDLEDNAILKVNPRRGGAEWHWVVWDATRRRLLDPRDPPYRRISACSYLRVR